MLKRQSHTYAICAYFGVFLAIDRNMAFSRVFLWECEFFLCHTVLPRVTLAKPGAEKLCSFQVFLVPQYHTLYSNMENAKSLTADFKKSLILWAFTSFNAVFKIEIQRKQYTLLQNQDNIRQS